MGTAGTNGVLVTQSTAEATPTLKTFTSAQPQALWFDGTYGMAVGRGNDVIVLHDGVWDTEDSPSFETLLSVVGDGVGGFVTLGSQGSLYIYNPATRTWDSLFQTQLSTLLTAAVIVDAAGSEAWAVGGNRLWHFQGDGWTSENLPDAPALDTLDAVALIADQLVIAGSADGSGHLLRRSLGAPGAPWVDPGDPRAADHPGARRRGRRWLRGRRSRRGLALHPRGLRRGVPRLLRRRGGRLRGGGRHGGGRGQRLSGRGLSGGQGSGHAAGGSWRLGAPVSAAALRGGSGLHRARALGHGHLRGHRLGGPPLERRSVDPGDAHARPSRPPWIWRSAATRSGASGRRDWWSAARTSWCASIRRRSAICTR